MLAADASPIARPLRWMASERFFTRPASDFSIGRLAGAIGADHRDRLALTEFEVDAEQRLEVAVERIERGDIEQRGHAGTPM